jgi:hypothetical protein
VVSSDIVLFQIESSHAIHEDELERLGSSSSVVATALVIFLYLWRASLAIDGLRSRQMGRFTCSSPRQVCVPGNTAPLFQSTDGCVLERLCVARRPPIKTIFHGLYSALNSHDTAVRILRRSVIWHRNMSDVLTVPISGSYNARHYGPSGGSVNTGTSLAVALAFKLAARALPTKISSSTYFVSCRRTPALSLSSSSGSHEPLVMFGANA